MMAFFGLDTMDTGPWEEPAEMGKTSFSQGLLLRSSPFLSIFFFYEFSVCLGLALFQFMLLFFFLQSFFSLFTCYCF